MKTLLLAIFVMAACSRCTCKSQVAVNNVKPSILNGRVLHGSTTKTTKVVDKKKASVFVMDITLGDMKITGSFHIPATRLNQQGIWCLNKDQIVQIGHDRSRQYVVLMPNVLYGSDQSCWVSGYLFHDLVDDTYVTRQVKFSYNDPIDKEDVSEEMTGVISPIEVKGNIVKYDLSFTWKNTNIDSFDSIFVGTLKGEVTRTVVDSDQFVSQGLRLNKGDQIINYSLKADNMTNTQLNNFINWWTHCVLPSF